LFLSSASESDFLDKITGGFAAVLGIVWLPIIGLCGGDLRKGEDDIL